MRSDIFGTPTPLVLAELIDVRLSLLKPFVTGFGSSATRQALLIHLQDADGFEGWGEMAAFDHPFYLPETVSTTWSIVTEWALPLAQSVAPTPTLVLTALSRIRGNNFARAGVESAFWTLAAARTNSSLSALLAKAAGADEPLVTKSRVQVGESVGIHDSIESTIAEVALRKSEGYPRTKLKIRPGWDVEVVRAVREFLGPDAMLQVDANSSYRSSDIDTLKALDEFNLLCIEQPLDWDDMEGHIDLQAQLRTPICLDECLRSLALTEEAIRRKATRNVNLKPARVGGIAASLGVHELCRSHGVDLWCGGMLESGIGRAINLAIASLPGFTQPGDLAPPAVHYAYDLVTPSYVVESDGTIVVPTAPGVGLTPDRNRIEDNTTRHFVSNTKS
jgi:O-succinylbenzoate synthase